MEERVQPVSRIDHWIYHWNNPQDKKVKKSQRKFKKALDKEIQRCYNTSKVKEQERR